MNENKYVVGIDVGTSAVKVVVGSLAPPADDLDSSPDITIVGVGVEPNAGMRKGTVVDINKVSEAVDKALNSAEMMCGQRIDRATVSINGSHISGVVSKGMIAINQAKIGPADVDRVVDAATIVKLPPNRIILTVEPRTYSVDGQDGVRDPIDMSGIRLEVDAYVVTSLSPHLNNLDQVMNKVEIGVNKPYVPAGLASARIALTDRQKENGAVLLDIGYATTTMVVYEESDIIDAKVFPVGSNNITTDLAIGLKTDLDIAEMVKVEHAVAAPELRRGNEPVLTLKLTNGKTQRKLEFNTEAVDDIVEARLSELFELIAKELKRIKRANGLPGGIVITGGGANLRGIADYAKATLGMNARIYRPRGYKGITDKVKDPAYTSVLGLLDIDAEAFLRGGAEPAGSDETFFSRLTGKLSGLFGRKA